MKRILLGSIVLIVFSLSIIIFQISCSKSSDAQNPTNCIGSQPKMQFKWNGTIYNSDAVFDIRIGWATYPYIKFISSGAGNILSSSNGQSNVFLQLYFPSSQNLAAGSYPVTNGNCACIINGTSYTTGTFTIVINIVANGYAEGTFSGSVSTSNGSSTLTITEGVFSNVPIVQ